MRSSQAGKYQALLPKSCITAGTRTERMITRVDEDRGGEAEAEEFDDPVFADHEGGEDGDHDRRGGGDHAAGQGEAAGDGAVASWLCSHSSWIRDIRKTS